MTPEEKIGLKEKIEEMASKGIERRAREVGCCTKALAATEGVVIYGVPLNETEIEALRGLLWLSDRLHNKYKEAADNIWEMLERGKR